MNAARTAAVAVLGALTLGLGAPAAAALVEPDPMAAGQRVTVTDGRRCPADRGARADSTLFGSVVLEPAARGMTADTTVARGATPGHYRVTIACGGSGGTRFSETVTVRDGRAEGVDASQAAGGLTLLALAGGAAYLLRRNTTARS
ncbi:hypothetical protein [Streptomyces gilvosporeus]|uniref:Sortase n=1 Tax=Streptomyces gilvosporeus TaxID=553510 RepID=A0A1V0TPA0_9ACTN|nr:hypothetical protein [Streptomyces gilvosporeus]ARF54502.1 hypothetical protein B1H19_10070 [Streptomyces gilvosporeus]